MTVEWIAVKIGHLRRDAEWFRSCARKKSAAKDRAAYRAKMRVHADWAEMMAKELYRIQEAVIPVLSAGQGLSNAAFNLVQPGASLDDVARSSLDSSRREWDEARRKLRDSAGL